jgi:DNA invertase Pin-like site-specific DNA recombinase
MNRPQLRAALNYVRAGNALIAHSMSSLGRELEGKLRLVGEMNAEAYRLNLLKRSELYRR